MSPKMPKELSDFRKKQILDASWKCFAENGYHKTTIRNIASSIGVSTGVIYNYFKSKDEILDGLFAYANETQDQLFEGISRKKSTEEAILELFIVCFESCDLDELKASNMANMYMWTEAIKKDKVKEMINIQFRHTRNEISKLIKSGIKRGEIQTDLNSKNIAMFLMALINGLQVQSVLIKDFDITNYFKEIKKILYHFITNLKEAN